MANNENLIPIPGRLHSVATEGHVSGADEIYDDTQQKDQETINSELIAAVGTGGSVDSRIAATVNVEKTRAEGAESILTTNLGNEVTRATNAEEALDSRVGTLEEVVGTGGSVDSRISTAVATETTRAQGVESSLNSGKADKATTLAGYGITDAYTKSETYTKTEVNGLVDTPHQEYVTVDAYASLPATGSKDTIYRVSNYNGSTSQVDASVYSEYAWDGTQYIFLCVKSQIGEVFDISVYNNNAKYADLAAALNGGANIPQSLQKGGMSVKFVQSSDNKYVQYRYMGTAITGSPNPFLDTANWQGIDNEPTAGSDNLVKSGGVYGSTIQLGEEKRNLLSVDGGLFVNNITENTSYKRTQPIQVQAGDFIVIRTSYYANYYYVVALCDYDGNNITNYHPVVPFQNNTGEYNYLVEKDGYILISLATSAIPNSSVRIKRSFLESTGKAIELEKYDEHLSRSNSNKIKSIYADNPITDFPYIGFIDVNGRFQSHTSFKASDFIPVEQGQTYRYIGMVYGDAKSVAFYDVDRYFIANSALILTSGDTFEVPSNAYYLRFSSENSISDASITLIVTNLVKETTFLSNEKVKEVNIDVKPLFGSNGIVKSNAIERISSKVLDYAYEESLDKNTALNKYYNTTWNTFLNNTDGRKASNPIYLKVGDRIEVYTAGMNLPIYGIVIWCPTDNIDTSAGQFVTKVAGNGETGFQTYEYIVDKEGYYIICWHSVYTESYAKIYHKETNIITTHINISKTIPILPQRKKLPCISLEFDDCIEGDEDAYNICKGYGIKCSFSFIASADNITSKRDRYLKYQNDGFSILSHSVDGSVFNTTNYPTAADAFNALYLSRKRLIDAGFIVNGFVAPNSTFVSDYIPQIEKVYNYAFTGLGDDSVKYSSRKCNLARYSMEAMALDDGTYNCLKGRITIAKSFGYNMTFYAHMRNIAETGTGANEWSYEKLRTFIAYLVSERDAGNIFIGNTDECMKNYFDSERMLQDGWVGGKHLIFNDDNTISWE